MARRLTKKMGIQDTPEHGIWLDRAELGLPQRLADRTAMERAATAWTKRRNVIAQRIERARERRAGEG